MFLDSLIDDADFIQRYARNAAGDTMPQEVGLETGVCCELMWGYIVAGGRVRNTTAVCGLGGPCYAGGLLCREGHL